MYLHIKLRQDRPFLTKLEFWREMRFMFDVIAAIFNIVGLQIKTRGSSS